MSGGALLDAFEALRTVGGLHDDKALVLERHPHHPSNTVVVFDEQNPSCHDLIVGALSGKSLNVSRWPADRFPTLDCVTTQGRRAPLRNGDVALS